MSDSVTPWTATSQASQSITNSRRLVKLMSIELVIQSNHLILYCPLLLMPSIFSSIRVFSNESVLCVKCPKYWNVSISPSNESSGLISFRMDWFDLLAVHHVVNFSHLIGISVSAKTAYRTWLMILSIALEEELKVLDFV